MFAFVDAMQVLMRSPHYMNHTLADLEWLLVPAVKTRQISIAKAQLKANGRVMPIGVIMWASVSPEVNARIASEIAERVKVKPDEWQSGSIIWLVDAIGDPKIIQSMIERLTATDWKGRSVHMRAQGANGQIEVATLEPAVA